MGALHAIDDSQTQEVIDACLDAYKYCTQTAAYLSQKGGAPAQPQRLQALHDCADVNLAAANFMSRSSPFRTGIAVFAADVSSACAETLAQIEHDDPQLRATYAACLRASQQCRELSGQEEPARYTARDEAVWESFPASDTPPTPSQI